MLTSCLWYHCKSFWELEALGQCIPPPRHVLPVSQYQSRCLSSAGDVMMPQLLWRCLLVHAVHCSVVQHTRLIPLSVFPNSDESKKNNPCMQTVIRIAPSFCFICSLTHCQPSLKISCKSAWKFLRKVANRQTGRQTDKQRRKHNVVGGGNENKTTAVTITLFTDGTTMWNKEQAKEQTWLYRVWKSRGSAAAEGPRDA